MLAQLQSAPKDSFAYLLAQVGSAFMSKGNQNLDDSDDDFDAAVGSSFGKK